MDDTEDHLSLDGGEIPRLPGEAPEDDGEMIAGLIDGAAEKNLDEELVAALAADALSPAAKAPQSSLDRSGTDSVLAAAVDDFMNGCSELDAQPESCRSDREKSNADTPPGHDLCCQDSESASVDSKVRAVNCGNEVSLRQDVNSSSTGMAPSKQTAQSEGVCTC